MASFSQAVDTSPYATPHIAAPQSADIRAVIYFLDRRSETALVKYLPLIWAGIWRKPLRTAPIRRSRSKPAVSTRATEIGTLRAIGFGALPVVISVLAEALVLGLIGAAVGSGVAWLPSGRHACRSRLRCG